MKSTSHSPQSAFSLVEVTMAIGIVAFAFVSLFGLLPIGLQAFHHNMDLMVRAQIHQDLIAQANQTEFQNIGQLASASETAPIYYYYDSEGLQMPESKKNQSAYTAALSFQNSASLPNNMNTGSLAVVKIEIFGNRGVFNGVAPAQIAPSSLSVLLADFGQRL